MPKEQKESSVETRLISERRKGFWFGVGYTIAVYLLTLWTNGMLDRMFN